jgi:hypothetical protein
MHAADTPDMVECLVKRPTWYNGAVAEPGTVVNLEKADAQYAVSIGRVEIVPAAEAEAVASTDGRAEDFDPPATAVTLDIHDVTISQTTQEVPPHG